MDNLIEEIKNTPAGGVNLRDYLMYKGYREHFDAPVSIARAWAAHSLFAQHKKIIYQNDVIAGSSRGLYVFEDEAPCEAERGHAERIALSYGSRGFYTNSDHFAPDYETILDLGVNGMIKKIDASINKHADNKEKVTTLQAMKTALGGFCEMAEGYAEAALAFGKNEMSKACAHVARKKPETFRQALQLVWLVHSAFVLEGRYAMALGRPDQYLLPFYERDTAAGMLTQDEAVVYLCGALSKIIETGDVVNISLGGIKRDGSNAENKLSLLLLEAVRRMNIPGPNLSARLHSGTGEIFLDECLKLIGTGIGYPALMNDEVNVAALQKFGYSAEDCRDYSMVGCIENFITGRQPPWSDARFNAPKYILLALNGGRCPLNDFCAGVKTPEAENILSMEQFTETLKRQIEHGAAEYAAMFNNENAKHNAVQYESPFLSCFCRDCIERGLDINNGGAVYPSVHGAACMGIATFADSLAAIDRVVFADKKISLPELRDILLKNFGGYERERGLLLAAPKYGNDEPLPDKYAVWYADLMHEVFSKFKTRDGGYFYTLIAANIQNISAGREIGATPDGRMSREPLSDAGSAMRGMDRAGASALFNSVSKPDYTKVAGGSVVNVMIPGDMFAESGRRGKLAAMIRTYMQMGGQELQINSVSKEVLRDAQKNPGDYAGLVVRVSGFSAFYVYLDEAVQNDILERTVQT
ncbi:MAG: hypothetical protein FWE82_01985 [Defluviitaleaceae bacterium]|nr:hypothetical protein [Defluviitaleaceae bacterium]